MENKLKKPTTEIISNLQAANIRNIMVTGKFFIIICFSEKNNRR